MTTEATRSRGVGHTFPLSSGMYGGLSSRRRSDGISVWDSHSPHAVQSHLIPQRADHVSIAKLSAGDRGSGRALRANCIENTALLVFLDRDQAQIRRDLSGSRARERFTKRQPLTRGRGGAFGLVLARRKNRCRCRTLSLSCGRFFCLLVCSRSLCGLEKKPP